MNSWDHIVNQIATYSVDILGAVLILIAGWIVAGWIRGLVRRRAERSARIDDTLAPILATLAYYLAIIFVIIMVLAQFGVQTASIIAALGAAGIAIGLALQGTLSNVAAGMMILFLKPFRVGDFIAGGGVMGTVTELSLFSTTMKTFDGVFVMVPNRDLADSAITNFSRLPTRRMDVAVGIAYSDDVDKGLDLLRGLVERDERVLKDPAPQVMVTELADSAVTLTMRVWANTDVYWDLLWDLNRAAKIELDKAGFTIPFPQREVHVYREGPQT
jgi:small conductance mechanosensitive channel